MKTKGIDDYRRYYLEKKDKEGIKQLAESYKFPKGFDIMADPCKSVPLNEVKPDIYLDRYCSHRMIFLVPTA